MIVESIFLNLMHNEEYFRSVLPHLKREYFIDASDERLFNYIKFFGDKHNKRPDAAVLRILLEKDTGLSDGVFTNLEAQISVLESKKPDLGQTEFMVEETENFCKQQALYNALSNALQIKSNAELPYDKRNKKMPDVGAIPDLMRDALSVCFNNSIGHNYLADWETRYDSYHDKAAKVPFGIDILNRITKGGAEYKTLNIILAGSNTGKSLGLCDLATQYLSNGLNVLYISMEMSEEAIGKRIDANLLGIPMDDLDAIPKGMFANKMSKLRDKVVGNLYFKQFPTGSAHVGHFRTLLQDLRTKQNFVPNVIMIDYLGICASQRIGFGGENSYGYVKAIAEEIRGLAIETNTVIWSAAQTTRGSWDESDIKMSDTAESAGLVHTADFMLGVVETDQLAEQGQQMFKQIKSRYGDKSKWSKFFMAVDKSLQRWSQLDTDTPDDTMPGVVVSKVGTDGSNTSTVLANGAGVQWDD